jgi:hypothetical protein
MKKIRPIYILILLFVVACIYGIINSRNESNELKKYGVVVDAKVKDIFASKGPYTINIYYTYHDKNYSSAFTKGNVDSLKEGSIIKVRISSKTPSNGPVDYLYLIRY